MRHEVNWQCYLRLRRIRLVSVSMAIPRRLQTGIVRPKPIPIPIYDHLIVVPISPPPLLLPGHYQFQYWRVEKVAAAKAAAATAASSILNPSNVSLTCVPNPSSKGTQSTDSGPGSSSSSKVKRRGSSGLLLRAVAEGCCCCEQYLMGDPVDVVYHIFN